MEPLTTPLVLTKLHAPVVRTGTVRRARLTALLTPEKGERLILVCAPAGYGKTTFLASWAQELAAGGTAAAWLSLDEGDDDPGSFSAYLTASLLQALGPLPELSQVAQLTRFSPEVDLQRILPVVINAVSASGRKCVFFLDDYQVIGSPAVHTALVYLLEHLPENMRVAIGSRSDPPMPLARLRARGQLREVRTADLRFTIEETGQFLNEVMQLELSGKGISILEERTEGWIAGLQLAALSAGGRADKEAFVAGFGGGQRYLVEYMLEEVVHRQPEDVRDFLMATSILARMNGELCAAVTGKPGGTETLRQLEQTNLFVVSLDEQGDWYRYHHLFREFLQNRLRQSQPERVPGLHRAACIWLAEHNLLREAARHALAAGDWEYAADFVEQHSFTLILHSEIAAIYEWCSALPEEVIQRHPMLCLLQGLALAYSFRRQNRGRIEARLECAERNMAKLEDPDTVQGLRDMAAVVKTFQTFAPDENPDPQGLLALSKDMTGAYPQGSPAQFSGLLVRGYAHLALQEAQAAGEAFAAALQIALIERLYFGIVESSFHLARLAQARGDLQQAADLCRQGRDEIARLLPNFEQALPAVGSLDAALGCVRLEQGQLDEAEALLLRGLALMGGGMNPYYLFTGFSALYRLYEIRNRPGEGVKYLERLEASWPDITFYTIGMKSKHPALGLSTEGETAAWREEFKKRIEQETFLPGMGPVGAGEAYYLAALAWTQDVRDPEEIAAARSYLQRQMKLAEENGLTQRVIEIEIALALVFQEAGEEQPALAALEHAVRAAMPGGYTSLFEQGPKLAGLMARAARLGVCEGEIRQILAARGSEYPKSPENVGQGSQNAGWESLSEREVEVLRLIAGGASNREVAQRLVITVGTVKSHINHILGKLDARNRTEAVAKARASGLLEI